MKALKNALFLQGEQGEGQKRSQKELLSFKNKI